MGHLDSKCKNTQSTAKRKTQDKEWTTVGRKGKAGKPSTTTPDEEHEDTFPALYTQRCHQVYLATSEPKQLVYSDQTGRFPVLSSAGKQYLLIAYNYDSNNILQRPLQSKRAECLTAAIQDPRCP
jgi:hypothetical protein